MNSDDPLWFKDAVIYEVPVKSFRDSDADGIGDLSGLTEKIDYLAGLGVTALWLLPFYPSPLRDDGYDISDYYQIHRDYGTMQDFRRFLRTAHQKGIRVITELVINHTSDQHPWFARSREAEPRSPYRDFYVWSDSPDRYADARVIFKDFEKSNWSYDAQTKAYYWHRFYSHQPDLNFDNPMVQREILKVMDFWFEMGVDGMRLDAVPYLFEREGTTCENLEETHLFLKRLRAHMDSRHRNKLLIAEANQWPEEAVSYFGNGDECHMCFYFPGMPRLFMALTMEDRFPIVDIMEQTPSIPQSSQWAMFLRNHDELTLEMVTDEERDFMYRAYAQDPRSRLNLGIRRRLAPLLGNDRRKMELVKILLFSLPGTPILYYGDEIGMGDNYYLGDRNGVRTPMQWSADRNAGFSLANPQKLFLPVDIDPEYHYEAVNVENQESNLSSFLWWMKRLISAHKQLPPLRRGSFEFLLCDNTHVLSFVRAYQGQTLLVAINLSRLYQVAELNLSRFAGHVPREAFSQNLFPPIADRPYVLTLSPYGYMWLILEPDESPHVAAKDAPVARLSAPGNWWTILNNKHKQELEKSALPGFLRRSPWFSGMGKTMEGLRIADTIPLSRARHQSFLLILVAAYTDGSAERYLLPISYANGEEESILRREHPEDIIASLVCASGDGVLYDGTLSEKFHAALLAVLRDQRRLQGARGDAWSAPTDILLRSPKAWTVGLASRLLPAGQGNTRIVYGETFFLKLYRRIANAANPEPEMLECLSERPQFPNAPAYAGAMHYQSAAAESLPLATIEAYVPNNGDAKSLTRNALDQYYEAVLGSLAELSRSPGVRCSLFEATDEESRGRMQELAGGLFLEHIAVLGRRTAELHGALAGSDKGAAFAPEPLSVHYQKSLYHAVRTRIARCIEALEMNALRIPRQYRQESADAVASRPRLLAIAAKVLEGRLTGQKIRIHGNLDLKEILHTGKDFVFIDFEGDPARSASERRLKYSPLRDVATLLSALHEAAYRVLYSMPSLREQDLPLLEPYVQPWFALVGSQYLASYIACAGSSQFLPATAEQRTALLRVFLLEKSLDDVVAALQARPEEVFIPLRRIAHLLADGAAQLPPS